MRKIFELNANYNKNELWILYKFSIFFCIVISTFRLVRINFKKISFFLTYFKYFEFKQKYFKYNVAHINLNIKLM